MNVPMRALTWATRFVWIIAITLGVSCIYSATLVSMNFGEPVINADEDLILTMPIIFDNKGYYPVDAFNFTTFVEDYEGVQISTGASSLVARIPSQNRVVLLHNVTLVPENILTENRYLFQDSDFTVYSLVGLKYASVVPFGLKISKEIPWGAPLFDFNVGAPQYLPYNATCVTMRIPVSFQNHSPYISVEGVLRVRVFNSINQLMGTGMTSLDVQPDGTFNSSIGTIVTNGEITGISVHVETPLINFTHRLDGSLQTVVNDG